MATVIEQTGDSVIIGGTDEVILYVNPAALKNSGFNENELIGSSSHIFSDGLMDASVIAQLRDTITQGQIWQGHYPRHPPWPATKRFSPGTSIGPGSCWMGWVDDLTLTVVWKLKIQRKMTADFSPVALRSFCEV